MAAGTVAASTVHNNAVKALAVLRWSDVMQHTLSNVPQA